MAATSGNDGVVLVNGNPVAQVTRFTYNRQADRLETSKMGDANKTYIAGDIDASGTLECWWDPTDTTGQVALFPGATGIALKFRPLGTGSGKPEITVTVAAILNNDSSFARNAVNTRSFQWAVGSGGTITEGFQA